MFRYVLKVKVEEAFSYVTLQMKLNHLELDTYQHMDSDGQWFHQYLIDGCISFCCVILFKYFPYPD
jgi:hypothetical protein